jgi:transcriptional regulator with XRE-family HTH domain
MGKVSDALKQVLGQYGISQNQLAIALGVERPTFFRWFHGQVDPSAETVAEIVKAIQSVSAEASKEFVKLYLRRWAGRLNNHRSESASKVREYRCICTL